VQAIQAKDLAIKVENLTKQYSPAAKAVNDLSFGLEVGEVFALLGITGAGKTSTFKCLTGEETSDCGSLFLGGHDVKTAFGQNQARCLIGYCPQFDAIFEGITVKEHLEIYAAIKGVRRDLFAKLVEKQLKEMDLTSF
jgi:ABC-type multidrug transport system ATPase subunit